MKTKVWPKLYNQRTARERLALMIPALCRADAGQRQRLADSTRLDSSMWPHYPLARESA